MTAPPTLPDKLYFRIGEAAAIVGVKPHVLRYWEEEFPVLRPAKSRTQQRLYQRKDLEFLLLVKDLLYVRGFTIAGARKHLRAGGFLPDDPAETSDAQLLLQEIHADLRRLRDRLMRSLPSVDPHST